ncbi:MAG: hypothetical protein M1821_001877 [Bathelium mastoideum]|nr:MAG: hypothetical protein M1821_001877 [Bathelium mastoideum]
MAQSKPHSVRRRMFTNVYAKSYLQTSSALAEITDSVINQRMLPRLLSATWSNPAVNVFELMAGVAMDIVTSYEFGLSAGTNFTQNEKACRHYLDLYHGRHSYTFYPQEIPLTTSFLEKMGIRFVPRFVSASNDELEAQCLKMCDDASAVLDRAQTLEISKGDYPIVYAQLRSALIDQHDKSGTGPSSPSPNEQQLELASEMFDHLAAGFDTSSITLTYLLWELSQRPQLQAQLRLELLTLAPGLQFSADHPVVPQSSSSSSSPPATTGADVDSERLPPARGVPSSSALPRFNHKAIDALPLLHALVLETLRRHPAIPGPQPRITPAGGKPCELAGYADLPAGVRVSAQAYSLHRNEDVFPEPEVWRPERWREAGEEQLREMQRWFWAFGSGGRMCVGSNLAMLQMKAIVAAIYTNFTTSIADDTGIEQEQSYTARPKARRLMIRFATVD